MLEHCKNCGKFVSETDGYFARVDEWNDKYPSAFCDEVCHTVHCEDQPLSAEQVRFDLWKDERVVA